MKEKFGGKKLTKEEDRYGYLARSIQGKLQKAQSSKIDSHLEKHKHLSYTYDFGDSWDHSIELVSVLTDYQYGYPILTGGTGDCPPEDVGGIPGYEEFLTAWHDPKDPNHDQMRTWGKSQNFEEFDLVKTNRLLKEFIQLKRVK